MIQSVILSNVTAQSLSLPRWSVYNSCWSPHASVLTRQENAPAPASCYAVGVRRSAVDVSDGRRATSSPGTLLPLRHGSRGPDSPSQRRRQHWRRANLCEVPVR